MRQENSKPANGCGCLVLLMFIGVMTAIALPSYMNMVNKSKQSQAKPYVISMNKSQQAEFAENGAFSNYIPDLELDIKTGTKGTKWYNYSTLATKQAAFNYGVPKQKELKSYVGGVFIVPAKEVDANAAKDEMATSSILCEADDRGTIEPAKPIYQNGKLICGKGTTAIWCEAYYRGRIGPAEAINQNAKLICGKGITANYKYSSHTTETAIFYYELSKHKEVKSYVSAVFVVPAKEVDSNAAKDEITEKFILCEADTPGTIKPAEPIYQNGKVICGKGTTEVTK